MANTLIMRGMLKRRIMRDILIGVTAGWFVGAAWWFGVALPRRRKYEEFYRNYDAEAIEEATKASFEEGEHYLEYTLVILILEVFYLCRLKWASNVSVTISLLYLVSLLWHCSDVHILA